MLMTRPEYSVISVGKKNHYGHPNKQVMERLEYFGSKIFRTDIDGGIIFKTDGNNLRIIDSEGRIYLN